jgi:hypothetical protein
MLSFSAMESIQKMELPDLEDEQIFIDTTYLEAYQQKFVLGQFRKHLMTKGAILVEEVGEAQTIVELRSAVLSTNDRDMLLGVPPIAVPIPVVGTFQTPELALIKQKKQDGVAGLAVLGYDGETRKMIFATDPEVGLTQMDDWSVIGIPVYRKRLNVPKNTTQQ